MSRWWRCWGRTSVYFILNLIEAQSSLLSTKDIRLHIWDGRTFSVDHSLWFWWKKCWQCQCYSWLCPTIGMTFIDIFTDSLLAIEYYYQYNNRWTQMLIITWVGIKTIPSPGLMCKRALINALDVRRRSPVQRSTQPRQMSNLNFFKLLLFAGGDPLLWVLSQLWGAAWLHSHLSLDADHLLSLWVPHTHRQIWSKRQFYRRISTVSNLHRHSIIGNLTTDPNIIQRWQL